MQDKNLKSSSRGLVHVPASAASGAGAGPARHACMHAGRVSGWECGRAPREDELALVAQALQRVCGRQRLCHAVQVVRVVHLAARDTTSAHLSIASAWQQDDGPLRLKEVCQRLCCQYCMIRQSWAPKKHDVGHGETIEGCGVGLQGSLLPSTTRQACCHPPQGKGHE